MILPRRPSWHYSEKSPAFYTGQAGCFCCDPPPPPPPPEVAYYYGGYYTRLPSRECSCCPEIGGSRPLATYWQLEVTDFIAGDVDPAPCDTFPAGTLCEENNGTFILGPARVGDPTAGGETCYRDSPAFDGTIAIPVGPIGTPPTICYECDEPNSLFWRLSILCSVDTMVRATLRLDRVSPNVRVALYDIDEASFDCMGPNTFTLTNAYDPFAGTGSSSTHKCCKGPPATLTLTPIA